SVRIRHPRRCGERDERVRSLPELGSRRPSGEFFARDPGLPAGYAPLRRSRRYRCADHGRRARRTAGARRDRGRGRRGARRALVPRAPLTVSIVDDDVGGPYSVGPRDVFHATLRDAGVALVQRATGNRQRIVLVYAEPRSWKGRADLGARSRAALRRLVPGAQLVVLLGHPRLAAQIPGTAPVLLCWHGQPLMQRAAARRLITWLKRVL